MNTNYNDFEVTYLVHSHKKGEGWSKSVRHAYKGKRELKYLSTYAEKSLLSYFVVDGDDFHCCARKHLL